MRSIVLSTDEIYHIFNRGVEKRNLFETEKDYARFYYSMVFFNSQTNTGRLPRSLNLVNIHSFISTDPLVNIIAYCFMPNHFHFLLEQQAENGITRYLHKICLSYAKYFNLQYGRVGALFDPKFKAKHINTQDYYTEISKYIHKNPLDLSGTANENFNKKFLKSYQWSSLQTYLGIKNEKFVDQRIMEDFINRDDYFYTLFEH